MRTFRRRRGISIAILIILAVVVLTFDALVSLSLHRTTVLSGWSLLVLIIGLALYNARKRLPFLPLGSSASWLQLHIYVGLFTILLFGLHVQWRLPNGILEATLAVLYLLVVGSGIIGLFITRLFARRLATRGEEVVFEQIPRLRKQIRNDVERLVLQCLSETKSTAIPEFYTTTLKPYFEGAQDFWAHLLHSGRRRQRLLSELDWQRRYLDQTEQAFMSQIAQRVGVKDDIDYHYAHQATLKYWLFIHIPLTYALLAFALSHAVLVYAFSGGMR